ncbi:dachshund homolog 1-like isoform X2 [Portunus trituberculatus]|uniref:dachshund homolog 1-like isoform X2 n=1 Tax=Portunus trituberculatus TaxID=210409 RepID=UPI001E1CB634|nr:dachshund homolog 1-like isoform X2 [Portunus trituberculatus]
MRVSGIWREQHGAGVQSSLPSLTYEAIRALGEDIQAFRQRHQMADEESHTTGSGGGGGGGGGGGSGNGGQGGKGAGTAGGGGGGGGSTTTTTTGGNGGGAGGGGNGGGGAGGGSAGEAKGASESSSKSANFEVPRPPLSPPSPLPSTAPPHKAPQAGTLAPGGSLPPLEIAVAPLEEAESDCLEEEDEEEGGDGDACSVCSCCEAESSVYAETDFAEEVRASLEEPGGVAGPGGRKHRHKRRPRSTYSTDSHYLHLPDHHCQDVPPYQRPSYPNAPHTPPSRPPHAAQEAPVPR